MTRRDLILYLIKRFEFQSYLEIGCADNFTFKYVKVPNKVGVDPERGGTVRVTSDEYFCNLPEDAKFDLIFIDGFHQSDQVYRDIENSLKHLNENGLIVLHDCNPAKEKYQIPNPGIWTGDAWKAFVHFRQREDLDSCCGNFNFGCGVIIKRKNTDSVKLDKNYLDLTWAELKVNKKKMVEADGFWKT